MAVRFSLGVVLLFSMAWCCYAADAPPVIDNVEAQPLGAQAKRVAQALSSGSSPAE